MFLFYHTEQNDETRSHYQGKLFENLLALHLTELGYDIELRKKRSSLEYDLSGIDQTSHLSIIGEAKAYGRPIPGKELSAFVGKLLPLGLLEGKIRGLFLSTSRLSAEAEDYYEKVKRFGVIAHTERALHDKIRNSLNLPKDELLDNLLAEYELVLRASAILSTNVGNGNFVCALAGSKLAASNSHFGIFMRGGGLMEDQRFLMKLKGALPILGDLEPVLPSLRPAHEPPPVVPQEWVDYASDIYFRRVLDVTSSLKEVSDEFDYDFQYFSEKLRDMHRETKAFLQTAASEIDTAPADRLRRLRENAERLRELPISLEKKLNLAAENLQKDKNHSMIHIILVEYAERFSARLSEVVDSLCDQEQRAAGDVLLTTRRKDTFSSSALAVINEGGIRRYQGLLSLLRNQRGELLRFLRGGSQEKISHEELLDALWGSFDLILIEELFARSSLKLINAIINSEYDSAERMKFVLTLVMSGFDADSLDWEGIESEIERRGLDERSRKVLLRSLTLHGPADTLRARAVKEIDLESMWRLLSFPQYPLRSANEIAKYILSTGTSINHQKILFDLQYDGMMRKALGKSSPETLAEIQRFVWLFSDSYIMIEPEYHTRYTGLVQALVDLHGALLADKIREIPAAMKRYKTLGGPVSPMPNASAVKAVPEVAMERLFPKAIYFYFIIQHPSFEIAGKALPHLEGEPGRVLQCLKNHGINQMLISGMAQNQRLLNSRDVRRAWALNPQAVGGQWVLEALERKDLEPVIDSPTASDAIKAAARAILHRRSRDDGRRR